ncbi:MAG: peptidoglycan DD-metalloendopeptidase family protein, partial [Solirubrobacteraceae bacterium]
MDWRPSELDPYPRAERDLGSVALWNRSSRRSHERRRRKAAARRNAPRQKGATLAAGAAVFASPLLAPVVGATAASSPPGVTTTEVAERAAVSGEDTWLLSYGDTGDAVAAVQRNLAILEDGIFGPQTEGAVKDFQRLKGLAATGVVDARTWAELFNSKVLFYDDGATASSSSSSVRAAYEAPEAEAPVAEPAPAGGPDLGDGVELRDEVSEPAPAPAPAPEAPAPQPVSTGDGCTADGQMIAPVDGPVTGTYGEDRGDHAHSGTDIAAPTGTPVRAAECGTVSVSGTESGYGTMVCVAHAGETTTCYAHLSERSVEVSEYVQAGQKIGEVGCTGSCTGPHVHFEVREDGQAQDPSPYLSGSRTTATATTTDGAAIGGPTPEEQAQVFAQTDAASEPTPTGAVEAPVPLGTPVEAAAEAPAPTAEAPTAAPVETAAPAPAEAPAATPVEAAAPAPAETPAVEPAVDA